MNNLTLDGRMVNDPTSYSGQSGSVVRFDMAHNAYKKGAPDNRETIFFRVSAFGKLGESVQRMGEKGGRVVVSGQFGLNSYTPAKGGEPKTTYTIVANSVDFFDKRKVAAAPAAPARSHDEVDDIFGND